MVLSSTCTSILLVAVLSIVVTPAGAGFRYHDFNQTFGLVLNGHATTSDCAQQKAAIDDEGSVTASPSAEDNATTTATAILRSNTTTLFVEWAEISGLQSRYTIETNTDDEYSSSIVNRDAKFGHKDTFASSTTTGCPIRLRLTNSYQSQVGSVWYEKRLPVLKGFETAFSFQVSDHSRTCSDHVDPSLSLSRRHRSCAVHGGDGFAFVIHADERDTSAIGHDGENLGYGGLNNSMAVEFDLWTNTVSQQNSDDYFEDHISVHSGSVGRNNPGESTALGYASPAANLADGNIHYVTIRYLPYIEEKFFHLMTANENLLPYLKDNGEGRRLGTLAVFLDDGIDANRYVLLFAPYLFVIVVTHFKRNS